MYLAQVLLLALLSLVAAQHPAPKPSSQPAADFHSADPVRDSNYVGVSVAWRVPEEVPTLVNTIVAKYADKVNQLQKDTIRKTGDKLSEELGQAKEILDGKNLRFTPWRTRMSVAVYQVMVSADRVHEIDRDKLEMTMDTLPGFVKALKELGETRLVNMTDQFIGGDSQQVIQLGASRPTPSGSQSFKGQTSTQVEYQDTGCILEVTSRWNPDDSTQGMLELGVEVSSVLESKIQISPKTFAPIIYQIRQRFFGPVMSGEPVLILSVDGNRPETEVSVYVTRAVLYHTKIDETKERAAP